MIRKTITFILIIICMPVFAFSDHPDTDTLYYWNSAGGSYYHIDPACKSVDDSFLPMMELTENDLLDVQFKNLKTCPYCISSEMIDTTEGGFPPEEADARFATEMIGTQSESSFVSGKYIVGTTIPEGFYTLHVPSNETGFLHITGEDGFARSYAINGEASYSVYLPVGAIVIIETQGTFTNIDTTLLFQEYGKEYHIKNMRYLLGIQVPNHIYAIKSETGKSGYYVLSTIDYDKGIVDSVVRVDLPPGETLSARFELLDFRFIEFVDCIVVPEYAEG